MSEKRRKHSASEKEGVQQSFAGGEKSFGFQVGGAMKVGGNFNLLKEPSVSSISTELHSAPAPVHTIDLFLSHISQEAALARLVEGWITEIFQGRISVFMDEKSIQMGESWLSRIEDALKTVRMMLVIASRTSLATPWINFEVGAAWARDIPIVFLCHSGVSPATLPPPYHGRQSLSLETPECPQKLLMDLASRFQTGDLPRWLAYGQMAAELHEELTGLAARPDLAQMEKTLEVGRSISAILEEGSPRPTA